MMQCGLFVPAESFRAVIKRANGAGSRPEATGAEDLPAVQTRLLSNRAAGLFPER